MSDRERELERIRALLDRRSPLLVNEGKALLEEVDRLREELRGAAASREQQS